MKNKIRISDIAAALNISTTTVSFILNGRAKEKRISDDQVKSVKKYVDEVGYKPNSLAKSLRTGKSKIIGLMVEDISNPFFATIARLIEDLAYKNGYKIIYCSTENDTAKTRDLMEMYQDRHVDGYIIAPPEGVEDSINKLISKNLPVVLFDRYLPYTKTDYVVVDNLFGAYNAALHLAEQGYRNIAFITFASAQIQLKDRLAGYQKAIAERGLQPYIEEINFTPNSDLIIAAIRDYLSKNKQLDAILFGTNLLAVSGLKVITQLGIKVPHDLAIVSFDDHDVFELYSPAITAVTQPVDGIANNVISLLMDRLNEKPVTGDRQNIVLPTTLIVRKSSPSK